jgi:hypothetical protein
MDNTMRLNDLVLYKINFHILLRRNYFLYNKEKEGIKQKNLSRPCFRPSSRKSKQDKGNPNLKIKKVPLFVIFSWIFFFQID